jgi:MFS transporter, ACS family, hexuronate transporter
VPAASSYRWVILAIVSLAQLSTALSSQAVAPLAPILQSDLGLSKTQIGIFSSASFAGTCVIALIAGMLTDRYGARKLMSLGQVVVAVFMGGMAFVSSLPVAIAVMFCAGLGCGTVPAGLAKSVTDWFPRSSRGFAMGIKQAAVPVGGMITASTLPVLALALGWRSAIALLGVWIVGASMLTAVVCRDAQVPWASREERPSVLVGMRVVIRNRKIWSLSVVSLLYVSAQLALLTYLALYLDEVVLVNSIPDDGARIIAAGGYLAICQAGGVFGRVFWGVVSDRLFHGRRISVLAIIGVLSAVALLVFANVDQDFPLFWLPAIVFCCGATSVGWNGLFQATITESVDRRHAGVASGLGLTILQMGTAGGPPLFGLMVDATGSFRVGWFSLALLCICGAIMSATNARWERVIE